jgi:hypothetical protein
MLRRAGMFRRFVQSLALAAGILFAAAAPSAARTLNIERFDVELTVNADGTLDVTESIDARFAGSWNGIYRTIPIEYSTPQGFDYSLFLDVKSVTDADFAALRYETSRERHYLKLKVYVPNAVDVTRTVHVSYHVYDGLKFFEDHDELYWNITGDEWQVPIEEASAKIHLPSGVIGLHALVFTGAYGAREQDAEVTIQGTDVQMTMRRALGFREGLTAVIGWDKGLVHEPSFGENVWLFLRSNWPLFIPVAVFPLVLLLWLYYGRDPRKRAISVQYEPPADLTPGEAGTLVDSSADMRDITATLIDLAVRGYIRIEETQKDELLGLMHSKEYALRLLKQPAEWGDARGHERELLKALFSQGYRTLIELHELENSFYKDLPGIREEIFDELMARKYFKIRPDQARIGLLVAAAVAGGAVFVFGIAMQARLGMQMAPFVVAAILTAGIIAGFALMMHERTIEGTRALETVLGFEEFLKRVEGDQLNRASKTPQMFEKFLPFAMALGVERQWCKAFDGIFTQPPSWYQGTGYGPRFSTYMFANSLSGMTTRASSMMTSAPRSSGGSGFSGGGGFSGG